MALTMAEQYNEHQWNMILANAAHEDRIINGDAKSIAVIESIRAEKRAAQIEFVQHVCSLMRVRHAAKFSVNIESMLHAGGYVEPPHTTCKGLSIR